MPRTNNVAGWPTKEDRVTDFDAEIVAAVEAFAEEAKHISTLGGFGQKLVALVQAKREALKPRPLTAEEAAAVYMKQPIGFSVEGGVRAVLDADRASIVRFLLEGGVTRYALNGEGIGRDVLQPHPRGAYIQTIGIEAALLPANPLTKRG